MFINQVRKTNPGLIDTALNFHQSGKIPPTCFVIDLDTVAENTRQLVNSAEKQGLSLYFITKQMGFNPVFAQEVSRNGIEKAVAVDWTEAITLHKAGISLGHVGHLVQIPEKFIADILKAKPDVITVFSIEKARQISRVAVESGMRVNIFMRIVGDKDFIYSGQAGGFLLSSLEKDLDTLSTIPNLDITGVTAFPCTIFNKQKKKYEITNNLKTLNKAAEIIAKRYSSEKLQINAPGNSCSLTFPLIRKYGATQAEPGNALTGTTPMHAVSNQPEKTAVVHVTEISHTLNNTYYCYGGGLYSRAVVSNALIGRNSKKLIRANVISPEKTSIDYYVGLQPRDEGEIKVGDSVLWSSRAQLFVTRASVAVVKGIQKNDPKLVGLFNSLGQECDL